ncbi:hypothetical protein AGABI2DRAFT_200902 [Agaricus bisporus var. bisporus H97]|uniref:hypothetical protein n=1 Tax=Agaricus bisporus var. bisporus (strain H97 / ATCC MYA-4626 / FGSC 10389) TaxID=936046 RepID=UPI00029F652F|nr:hypothetical protein AGABI2DRAFT_200902 [Agaricus bisporus var. bisporus H97]EKV48917.1 hypothetical protein AGABI2DRAFT_200902 [Agaricus bisporus var. bisporus H97]
MKTIFALLAVVMAASASPAVSVPELQARDPAVDNIVYVTDAENFCMIMPRNPNTNIGDSEHPGGTKTYCSPAGRYSSTQGQLPPDFWSNVEFKTGHSSSGGRFAQLTGCIRPEKLSRLNPNDGGGQYDSSGGAGGNGNPIDSVCLGYNHYVELVEPGDRRACIKCCDNYDDCPLDRDTSGCPAVIQGNYFDCN